MSPSPSPAPAASPAARAARVAVSLLFFVNGFGFASWVPHIPTVQSRLGLSPSLLGVALLATAVGAIIAMPLTGAWVARWGSKNVTFVTALSFCALVSLPVRAPTFPLLLLAMGGMGAFYGAMDVAMNAHAIAVEQRLGRPVMSSFHALYSLGGLAGAGGSILWLSWGLTPPTHMLGAAVFGLLAVLGASRFLLADVTGEGGGHSFALPRGPLLTLGLLTLMGLMVEGAMADWSAVYLRQSLGSEAGLAGAGFATFSLTMASGRFLGDWLNRRFGPTVLVRVGATIAACGLGIALLLHHPVAAMIGFGCVGLGMSNVIPLLFSASGRMPGISASVGIAAVTTTGYGGFLAGPPLVGFLSEQVGLPVALGLLVVLMGLIAVLGSRMPGAEASPAQPQPPTMRIEHLALWTRDIERLRAFYEAYFQASASPRYVNERKQFTSYFLSFASGARLEIMSRPQVLPLSDDALPRGYAHLAISVGSQEAVDAMARRFRDDQVPVLDGPRRTGDGYYECVVLDPEGNRIEVTV